MCDPINSNALQWDLKVNDYPRFTNGENCFEINVLNLLKDWGIDFNNSSVLDIGCGTGVYTLHVAKIARSVDALDFSKNMLDILVKDAKSINVSNITTYCKDFEKFEKPDKSYDWVFTTMSPALNSSLARQKANDLALKGVAYLGWGGKRESKIMEAVFNAHEHKLHAPPGSEEMKGWLKSKNINFKSKYLETTWVKNQNLDDAINSEAWHLNIHGIKPDKEKIRNIIEPFCDKNGNIENKTNVGLELITWFL